MKIILSPAKKMRTDNDWLLPSETPIFIENTKRVLQWLQGKSYEELKALWKCNDSIAKQNFDRIQGMKLDRNTTPAVLAYEGIAYQYMAPAVFEEAHLKYVQDHLRILSAFYGVLKPMDGVVPYRLEMQAKADIDGCGNLYNFWEDSLYKEICDDSVIINLASKEYSKCVEKYLQKDDRFITIDFCEESNGKLVTKGTYAKMARGEMVRFMAENNIEDPENIKKFDRLGYAFRDDLSDEKIFVFERIIK